MNERPSSPAAARVAVVVACHNDGGSVAQAVRSVAEPEPVEVVVVDDGSTDEHTREALGLLEAEGHRVLRLPSKVGAALSRNAGLEGTRASYVFPLDAHDLAIPGALTRMADRLDGSPDAGVCMGDYEDFRVETLVRVVPERLDPYRVAFTNEYPISSMFRRRALDAVGGWRRLIEPIDARSDWNLWMSLAERGMTSVHLGDGHLTYIRRMHGGRLAAAGRRFNRRLYRALREQHPALFSSLRTHRARTDLGRLRAFMYPIVYGRRPRSGIEVAPKALLDRLGIWTLTGDVDEGVRRELAATFASAEHRRPAPAALEGDVRARVAVVIPCHGDGPFVADAVRSIDEREPVEVVIVDDASTDEGTHAALRRLEEEGHRVIRQARNQGVSATRNVGLRATMAPYVFPLDADDLAVPGVLSRMADELERNVDAAVCFGDYAEFRVRTLARRVPEHLDPFRLAHGNAYPASALFRRETIETAGGWRDLAAVNEDWDLWLTLAERDVKAVHLGRGELTYRRRISTSGDDTSTTTQDSRAYAAMRDSHPQLFGSLSEHRRHTDMGIVRRALYPLIHRRRSRTGLDSRVKVLLARWGRSPSTRR